LNFLTISSWFEKRLHPENSKESSFNGFSERIVLAFIDSALIISPSIPFSLSSLRNYCWPTPYPYKVKIEILLKRRKTLNVLIPKLDMDLCYALLNKSWIIHWTEPEIAPTNDHWRVLDRTICDSWGACFSSISALLDWSLEVKSSF
jgi:hypothetical protein